MFSARSNVGADTFRFRCRHFPRPGENADTFLAHSNADTFKEEGTNVHLVCKF
jgi:hypothetical protein